jgi:hypothetical protein
VYGFSIERFVVLIAMMKSVDGIPKLRDALKGAWRERVFAVPGPAGCHQCSLVTRKLVFSLFFVSFIPKPF